MSATQFTPKPGALVDAIGDTHVALNSEHLVCHSATSDAADTEYDDTLRWLKPTRREPSCAACAQVINACRKWV